MKALRPTARLAGLALVAVGVVLLVVALPVPWADEAMILPPRPGLPVMIALVVLGPLASLFEALWRSAARLPLVGAGGAVLGCGLAGWQAHRVDAARGPGFGGALAVLACAAVALGWLLLTIVGRAPLTVSGATAVGAGVLVLVVAAGTVPVVQWYASDRFVRASTAGPLPPLAVAAPTQLNQGKLARRWQATFSDAETRRGETPPVVVGRSVVVPQGDGVRVLDVETGQPRWAYRRDDGSALSDVTAVAGGRTTLLLYRAHFGALAVALDSATGRQRWTRRYPGLGYFTRGWLVDGGDVALVYQDEPFGLGALIAVDLATGAQRWLGPDRVGPASCQLISLVTIERVAALALHCAPGADDYVVALSTRDGRTLWRWQPKPTPGAETGGVLTSLPMRAAAGRFWVAYSETASKGSTKVPVSALLATSLDPATGTAVGRHILSAQTRPTFTSHGVLDPILPLDDDAIYLRTAAGGGSNGVPAGRVTSVDLSTGRSRWSTPVPELAAPEAPGSPPLLLGAVGRGTTAYLLLMPPSDLVESETGSTDGVLLVLGADSGAVRARVHYRPAGCTATCTPRWAPLLVLTPDGVLVVERGRTGTIYLTALR